MQYNISIEIPTIYGHGFFLSVRKLKNQPSNKLLLALFFIQTVKEGNIRD